MLFPLRRECCKLCCPSSGSSTLRSVSSSSFVAAPRPNKASAAPQLQYSRAEDATSHPTQALYPSKRSGPTPQRQRLSTAESRTFEELLRQIVPQPVTPHNSSSELARRVAAVDAVQAALKRSKQDRHRADDLLPADLSILDSKCEVMSSQQTDHHLLRYAMLEVFGELPSSASPEEAQKRRERAQTVPYFPDLLVHLFLLLRDTHRSPHAALQVFSLASRTPASYLRGCTTKLYNEVLRTRWMLGDIESVATGLEEMRGGGVRVDQITKTLVEEIGIAVRRDDERATERAAAVASTSISTPDTSSGTDAPTPPSASTSLASEHYRHFSSAQLAAWSRADAILEEFQEEAQERHTLRQSVTRRRMSQSGPLDGNQEGRQFEGRNERSNSMWESFPL
ncbi:hypothetical protein P7C70_g4825, partial [Phenoliferia sp. Uapishka_3]